MMVRRLEHVTYKDSKRIGWISLRKRRLKGNLVSVYPT